MDCTKRKKLINIISLNLLKTTDVYVKKEILNDLKLKNSFSNIEIEIIKNSISFFDLITNDELYALGTSIEKVLPNAINIENFFDEYEINKISNYKINTEQLLIKNHQIKEVIKIDNGKYTCSLPFSEILTLMFSGIIKTCDNFIESQEEQNIKIDEILENEYSIILNTTNEKLYKKLKKQTKNTLVLDNKESVFAVSSNDYVFRQCLIEYIKNSELRQNILNKKFQTIFIIKSQVEDILNNIKTSKNIDIDFCENIVANNCGKGIIIEIDFLNAISLFYNTSSFNSIQIKEISVWIIEFYNYFFEIIKRQNLNKIFLKGHLIVYFFVYLSFKLKSKDNWQLILEDLMLNIEWENSKKIEELREVSLHDVNNKNIKRTKEFCDERLKKYV